MSIKLRSVIVNEEEIAAFNNYWCYPAKMPQGSIR